MIHLVTGYAGYEHIKSEDDGAFNASFFGDGQYIMAYGNQFEASIIDNNTVRVLDGNGLMYGRHFRLADNMYEDVAIANGAAGTNRCDLICMTYLKDEGAGTESVYLEVIKGAESTGTAAMPAYTNGNILEGAVKNQMPLYTVSIEGVVLKSITPVFETIPTYKQLAQKYAEQFETAINDLKTNNILDTLGEVEANQVENQIAGALALKELARRVPTIVLDATNKIAYITTNQG